MSNGPMLPLRCQVADRPEQRIPDGLRRLEVLLPIEIVVELDVGIAHLRAAEVPTRATELADLKRAWRT